LQFSPFLLIAHYLANKLWTFDQSRNDFNCAGLKSRKPAGRRLKWSTAELRICQKHFHHYFQAYKPPNFTDIDEAQEKYPELKLRTRSQIKSRVWHMIQTGH